MDADAASPARSAAPQLRGPQLWPLTTSGTSPRPQSRGPQQRDLSVCADPASTSRGVRPGSPARHPDLRSSPLGGGRGAGHVNSGQSGAHRCPVTAGVSIPPALIPRPGSFRAGPRALLLLRVPVSAGVSGGWRRTQASGGPRWHAADPGLRRHGAWLAIRPALTTGPSGLLPPAGDLTGGALLAGAL